MKIIAIDYGDVRTGIAVSDITETLASPLCVIKEKYLPNLIEKICQIIKEQNAQKVIIGLPRNMDGSYGYRCDECKALGEELSKKIDLEIDYIDERLTTVMAHDILSSNNVNSKKRKSVVDAVSAVMILQSYLDKK